MHIVFSCENTQYMWWQAELLHYTYKKTGMQAELTALVSVSDEPARDFTCPSVTVANYEGWLGAGSFKPLNKPGGIAEWALADGPKQETVLIVDPDSAFVGIVQDPGPLKSGEAYSQEHDYMNVNLPASQTVLSRHCNRGARELVQPIGIYVMVSKTDLAELASRWLHKTIEIKNDPICRAALPDDGWISDMWGYSIAAAELGIRHRIINFSQVTGSNCIKYPIIHYCFPLVEHGEYWDPNRQQTFLWSKWDYNPWVVPQACTAPTLEGRVLLENLAELALTRNRMSNTTDAEEPRFHPS